MRPSIVLFQGPLVTFNGGSPLSQAPEGVQATLGVIGLVFLAGTLWWLSRGGSKRLPHRKTQPWDF